MIDLAMELRSAIASYVSFHPDLIPVNGPPGLLLDDAKAQMGRFLCFHNFCRFELDMLAAKMLK